MNIEQAIDHLSGKAQKTQLDMEILFTQQRGFRSSFQNQTLDKYQYTFNQCLGIRILHDCHEGLAWTEDFSPEALSRCFNEAHSNSLIIEKPYKSTLIPPAPFQDIDTLYHQDHQSIKTDLKLEKAKQLEKMTLDYDSRIHVVPHNVLGDYTFSQRLFHTRGMDQSYKKSFYYAFVSALAKAGNVSKTGNDFFYHKEFDQIDPATLASKAAEEALNKLDAQNISSGRYPIILQAKCASNLFAVIAGLLSAKRIDEKTSLLVNKLNEQIMNPKISIYDHPRLANGLGSRPFDDEGTPSQKTLLVERGVLKSYLTNSIYAKKMGLPNTGNASREPTAELSIAHSNFIIEPGQTSLTAMQAHYPQMVVVNELSGLHAGINSISGDFSLQATGDLFQNGERQHAVHNFTISGNLIELFSNIEIVGNDVPTPTQPVVSPSILVNQVDLAGSK